jgi:5'-nucleotidase/UDP-sugar diphosphatase
VRRDGVRDAGRRARRPARSLAALAALAAALGGGACAPGPGKPEPLNPVRFLAINDVYVADVLGDGTGGLARVATVRARLEDEGPVIFALAGDVLSPSLLSKYYGGRQMVEALNAAGLDYATFGNHEFELPRDTLVARIAESKFRWLSSNCTEATGSRFPRVLPWDTVRASRHLVGIFGLTLQGDYRRYVRCTDPDSAARRAIAALDSAGADLIVGLTHQSLGADEALLARESRLDLILGGHEHEAHRAVVARRHVLKADANARTAQFATLWGGRGKWRQAVRLLRIDADVRADSATARVVARWADSLRRRLGPERVVGRAEAPLDARDAVSRREESALGNLIADAIRAGTGADVALLNAGTIRLDDVIAPGPVTNYQLESIFLFADETRIVSFPLPAARLREVLEHSVADGVRGTGGFLQVSGVRFAFDSARPSGARIVGDLARPGGGTIRPGDTLRVATGVFLACEGGDRYHLPEAAPACADRGGAPRAVDLLIAYVRDSLGGRLPGATDGRIARAPPRPEPAPAGARSEGPRPDRARSDGARSDGAR